MLQANRAEARLRNPASLNKSSVADCCLSRRRQETIFDKCAPCGAQIGLQGT
jgi:hypothetical protein